MPGRNDLCPCGSGKKFKHCHLNRGRGPQTLTLTSRTQPIHQRALNRFRREELREPEPEEEIPLTPEEKRELLHAQFEDRVFGSEPADSPALPSLQDFQSLMLTNHPPGEAP
jgi:hypothetical protein